MANTGRMNKDNPRVALLGAPFDDGAAIAGAALGPAALRAAGLAHKLKALGYEVADHGDLVLSSQRGNEVDIKGPARNAARVAALAQALSRASYNLICGGVLPIFLGGDHSISMGTVNGVARHFSEHGRKFFVLWLDAHADFNIPTTTATGNMHGMSLAHLCGERSLAPILGNQPRAIIDPSQVWIFGARAIDPGEGNLLRKRGVNVIEMALIRKAGLAGLLRHVLDIVTRENGALHLSLDIDFLDPIVAPATGTPISEGATYLDARLIMEMLNASQLLSSVDIVELNPALDQSGVSANIVIDLIAALFSGRGMGNQTSVPSNNRVSITTERCRGMPQMATPSLGA